MIKVLYNLTILVTITKRTVCALKGLDNIR